MKVLIVEDTKTLAKTLADMVYSINISSDIAYTGEDAFKYLDSNQYDAIILDLILPDISGFDVLQIIRSENNSTPVLILSARNKVQDRVKGLNIGANYYLTKPFEVEEFLACLEMILRLENPNAQSILRFSDIELNINSSELICNKSSIALNPKELKLLKILIQNPRQIIPKNTLISKVWGYDSDATDNNLEAYISFIRKKLSLLSSKVTISIRRKAGYYLEEKND
mgnify:CR=1 FL=1